MVNIPDPRPAKADPHHRSIRKEIEDKNSGFGWKKALVLGLVGFTLIMNIPKEVEKHEKQHEEREKQQRSNSSRRDGGSDRGRGDRGRSQGRSKSRNKSSRRRPTSMYDYRDDNGGGGGGGGGGGRYGDNYYYSGDDRRDSYYSRPARGRTWSQGSW